MHSSLLLGGLAFTLISCFSSEDKAGKPHIPPQDASIAPVAKKLVTVPTKDKSLDFFVRYFGQADAIHREAWWVLTEERRPVGKSPFGKVQRALLSSQNIKLSNKSLFRCDRYMVKREVLGLQGYPQRIEIFEKCSEKLAPHLLARVSAGNENDIQVTFYPEGLEEVLGLGASVVNRAIQCTLKGNEQGQLIGLSCKDWAQDRNKEQMIRLDTYDYEKEGKNLIKLRGKVFENLTDTRKIVADVPLEGKVEVLETELYPPVDPAPAPVPSPIKALPQKTGPQVGVPAGEPEELTTITPLPPPREQVVDPDVLLQQQLPPLPPPEMLMESSEPGESQQPQPPEGGGVRHGR